MYILTTKSEFDSAHFLKDYEGKCSNMHGHRWTVEVEVRSESVQSSGPYRGMVVDFALLKGKLKEETDRLDHKLIVEEGSLSQGLKAALLEEGFQMVAFPWRPTAENFSKYFFDYMKDGGYPIYKVSVYETPNNVAAYMED